MTRPIIHACLLLLAFAGCGGFDYTLTVIDGEPPTRPPRGEPVSVFIDGVETAEFKSTYGSSDESTPAIIVQLRYGDVVIA